MERVWFVEGGRPNFDKPNEIKDGRDESGGQLVMESERKWRKMKESGAFHLWETLWKILA